LLAFSSGEFGSSQWNVSAVATNPDVWEKRMNGVVGANRVRSRAAASPDINERERGSMDDTSRRLSLLEAAVAEIRALLGQTATKADLGEIRVELRDEISSSRMETQSVRLEVQVVRTEVQALRADVNAMETRMIKWMIGTTISTTLSVGALAFSIAKFVH
jgi:hypothetical protein